MASFFNVTYNVIFVLAYEMLLFWAAPLTGGLVTKEVGSDPLGKNSLTDGYKKII